MSGIKDFSKGFLGQFGIWPDVLVDKLAASNTSEQESVSYIEEEKMTENRCWSIDFAANAVADAATDSRVDLCEKSMLIARFCDQLRVMGITPSPAQAVEPIITLLDEAALLRMSLLIIMLEHEELYNAVTDERGAKTTHDRLLEGIVGTAKYYIDVDRKLVSGSMVRAEDIARHFAHRLGIGICGETEEQSGRRREKIDYQQLLEVVDQSKESAQQRLRKLLKSQEESDESVMRRRRGKW